MLRRVQIACRTRYTWNLNLARHRTALSVSSIRFFSSQSIEGVDNHEYGKRSPPISDPLALKGRAEWDPRFTLKTRNLLEKFSILPEQTEISPLGCPEERVLELVGVVEGFSDQLSMLDRSELLRVTLLKYALIQLDTTRLKLAIQTLIDSQLDPDTMLAAHPTLIYLDLTQFSQNARTLIETVFGDNIWKGLTLSTIIPQLKKLFRYHELRNEGAESGVEAVLVDRLYRTLPCDGSNEYAIYGRIYRTVKKTVEKRSESIARFEDYEKLYARMKTAAITKLCLRHFKEVVMGISPEFIDGIVKSKRIGFSNSLWVSKFLEKISARKILVKSDQTTEDTMPPLLSLMEKYGVNCNYFNLVANCPQLVNTQVEDVKKSVEIVQYDPFYLSRYEVSKVFCRNPSIFLTPNVLESSRQQILQIPLLKNREIKWCDLLFKTPRILVLNNHAKIFDLLENHGFLEDETLLLLRHSPYFLLAIEEHLKKLESPSRYDFKIARFSKRIEVVRRRMSQLNQVDSSVPTGPYQVEMGQLDENDQCEWGEDSNEELNYS